MELFHRQLLVALLLPALAIALGESAEAKYIWGSTVINVFGDRIPLLAIDDSTLTTVGAQQMNDVGAMFRSRYLTGSDMAILGNMTIQNINPDIMDDEQTQITSMQDIFVQQSAQAFMAGLYPPTMTSNVTTPGRGNVGGPVGGLQYPQYYFASPYDPNYIFLNGSSNCPNFDASVQNLMASSEFSSNASAAQPFYDTLNEEFTAGLGEFAGSPRWYGDAYYVYDWLQYLSTPNDTIHTGGVTPQELAQARALADSYMYSVYGNYTADNGIRAIGGTTLAATIVNSLYNNVYSNATSYNLNLYFVGVEPMISLAAILGLPELLSGFQYMPDEGSSMVFEMYSPASTTTINNGIPEFDSTGGNLRIRLLFRNGTDQATNLTQVPLFNTGSDGVADISYNDFVGNMSTISISSVGAWCEACNSAAVWCAYYTNGQVGLLNGADNFGSRGYYGLAVSPAIGGVIGAIVALIVGGFTLVAVMCCFGLRFHKRQHKGGSGGGVAAALAKGTGKKKGALGGFKGGEKLASDVDLPRGAENSFGATVVNNQDGQGHRRVESWELREGRKARQSIDSQRDGGMAKEVEAV